MLLVIPNKETYEAGVMPSAELVGKMMVFNQQLGEAGALIALDGLKASSAGARVSFGPGGPSLIDGPFTESKEIIGGYWIIQVANKEEAVAWALKAPMLDGEVIEVRQIFEMSDFPEDVQAVAVESAVEIL